MNENVGTTTVVKIEADGNKTVITKGGGVHSDTNTNFRFIQECLDWVVGQLVSFNSMGGEYSRVDLQCSSSELLAFLLQILCKYLLTKI